MNFHKEKIVCAGASQITLMIDEKPLCGLSDFASCGAGAPEWEIFMEIERKFLVEKLPSGLSSYESLMIEQAYLCTDPVIRIRRENENYYMTYKSRGLMTREEYNLPLNAAAYEHLLDKADGNIISKKRYLIPIAKPVFASSFALPASLPELKIELDVFEPPFAPLVIAEVEFPDEETANAFIPPAWLGEDVTNSPKYHNSYLSEMKL